MKLGLTCDVRQEVPGEERLWASPVRVIPAGEAAECYSFFEHAAASVSFSTAAFVFCCMEFGS